MQRKILNKKAANGNRLTGGGTVSPTLGLLKAVGTGDFLTWRQSVPTCFFKNGEQWAGPRSGK